MQGQKAGEMTHFFLKTVLKVLGHEKEQLVGGSVLNPLIPATHSTPKAKKLGAQIYIARNHYLLSGNLSLP